MMPAMYWMRLAVSPSRSALMIGMPPATAASNATITPLARAASKISVPCTASSALLAVTTCLPLAIARSTSSRATPVPPIISATMSIDGSSTTALKSSVSATVPAALPSAAVALAGLRTAMRAISMPRPARRLISS